MKAYKLLFSLPKKADEYLHFVMNQHPRKTLQKLYAVLKKTEGKEVPSKELLFRKTFGETWSSKKDYLLRNELRLLVEEMEEALSVAHFISQSRANGNLRNSWINMALLEADEDLCPEPLTALPLSQDFSYDQPGHYANYAEKWLKRQLEAHTTAPERAELLTTTAEALIALRETEASRKLAQAWVMYTAALRWQGKLPDAHTLELAEISLGGAGAQTRDAIAATLYYQFRSMCLSGREKTDALLLSLTHLELCANTPLFDKSGKKMALLAAIALEYFIAGDYEQADSYYRQSMEADPKSKHPQTLAILFNYISNLTRVGRFTAALEIIGRNKVLLEQNEQTRHLHLCIAAMCHLFSGEPSRALRLVPPDIQHLPPGTFLYFRFIQVIAFSLLDMPEDALREAQNLLRMLRYWKRKERTRFRDLDLDYMALAKWLTLYLEGPLTETGRRQLEIDIDIHSDAKNPLFRDYLPLRWLRGRLR